MLRWTDIRELAGSWHAIGGRAVSGAIGSAREAGITGVAVAISKTRADPCSFAFFCYSPSFPSWS